jgi:HAD superfamily hydrolase (TIGR01549 family)
MIHGFFFDLFGTLMLYTDMRKAWDDWLLALHENFREFGLKIAKNSFALKCNGFFKKPEPSLRDVNLTLYENRLNDLGRDLGLNLRSEELRKTAMDTIKAWQKYVPLDPEAITILETLKKSKKLALITNFDYPPHVYSLLSNLKLRPFFDSIVISSEVNVKKPNPMIFSLPLEHTKLNSNEVCYVGDTREDMKAAINAKIHPIFIQRNPSFENESMDDYYMNESTIIKDDKDIDYKSVKIITRLRDLINIVD